MCYEVHCKPPWLAPIGTGCCWGWKSVSKFQKEDSTNWFVFISWKPMRSKICRNSLFTWQDAMLAEVRNVLHRAIFSSLEALLPRVDDVVSTGGTLQPILKAIDSNGAIVQDCWIVFEKGDGMNKIRSEGEWPMNSLVRIEMIDGEITILD